MTELDQVWAAGGRDLFLTDWVGMHPDDDDRFAHLLIVPRHAGLTEVMASLAEDLELARVCDADGNPTVISVSKAWCAITEINDRPYGAVYRPSGALGRPVDQLWIDALRQRNQALLTIALDPPDILGRVMDLDAVLRGDTSRIYAGFLAAPGTDPSDVHVTHTPVDTAD